MANDPLAQAATPDAPSEDEYQAFLTALSESARGRAFLAEHARRSRNEDSAVLLSSVQRLEGLVRAQVDAPPAENPLDDVRGMLDSIRRVQAELDVSTLTAQVAKLAELIEGVQQRIDTLATPPAPQEEPAEEAAAPEEEPVAVEEAPAEEPETAESEAIEAESVEDTVEAELEAQAELEAETPLEAEPDAEAPPEAEAEAEMPVEAEAEAGEVEPEAELQTDAEAEADAPGEPEAEVQAETEVDAEAEVEAEAAVEAEPEVEGEAEAEVEAEAVAETDVQAEPEIAPEAEVEAEPEVAAEAEAEVEAEAEPEAILAPAFDIAEPAIDDAAPEQPAEAEGDAEATDVAESETPLPDLDAAEAETMSAPESLLAPFEFVSPESGAAEEALPEAAAPAGFDEDAGMPEVAWGNEAAAAPADENEQTEASASPPPGLAIAALVETLAAAEVERAAEHEAALQSDGPVPEATVIKAGSIPPPAPFTGEDFSASKNETAAPTRRARAVPPPVDPLADIKALSEEERLALFT